MVCWKAAKKAQPMAERKADSSVDQTVETKAV